jgi:hypothetical protein
MAELATVTRTKVDQVLGRKSPAAMQNRIRTAVIQTPATYAAPAQNDTAGTELYLKQGSRVLLPVTLSCAVGTASSTVRVGIRDAVTKVAIDATAVLADTSIATAATGQHNTGTKCTGGQEYFMPQDVELYLTFTGAAGTANQLVRIEVQYVSP